MHLLTETTIVNFRSCKQVTIHLAPFTPIVGRNNCGKSNIIAAIKWLLKPAPLTARDFYSPASSVAVSGSIDGLTPEHLAAVSEDHRKRIAPFCADGRLRIRRVQATPSSTIKSVTLEVRNPNVTQEDVTDAWTKNPTGIDAAIRALFPEPIEIGAMEDATEDIGAHKKETTIGKLIATLLSPLEKCHGADLHDALSVIGQKFAATGATRAPELNDFDTGANELLQDLFPGLRLRLHIRPPEFQDLFKSATLKVFEGSEEDARDVDLLGHGAQRSIQLALVRYLAAKAAAEKEATSCTLLLIDEPELFLHPQAIEQVRTSLKSLSSSGYQVIFSTHSPLMIDLKDVPQSVVVQKQPGAGTIVRKCLREALVEVFEDAPSQSRLLFELGNASRVLFASRVLLAEGTTEERILPTLFRHMRGKTFGGAEIALVGPGGSSNIPKCLRVLAAMDIPSVALVDLDFAFRDAVAANYLMPEDADYQTCRERSKVLAGIHGFQLASDDFPKKGGNYTAAQAFALLAADMDAQIAIEGLHTKLRDHGIWLWTRGAIEDHLGLDGKDENAWARYCSDIEEKGCDAVISDLATVAAFLEWLDTGVSIEEATLSA